MKTIKNKSDWPFVVFTLFACILVKLSLIHISTALLTFECDYDMSSFTLKSLVRNCHLFSTKLFLQVTIRFAFVVHSAIVDLSPQIDIYSYDYIIHVSSHQNGVTTLVISSVERLFIKLFVQLPEAMLLFPSTNSRQFGKPPTLPLISILSLEIGHSKHAWS